MNDARQQYWRSLDELTSRPEFREALAREFPAAAELPPDWLNRRDFVKLLGASLALAGVHGCVRRPDEPILPYVRRSPELTPAAAEHYATAMTLDGYATGLLVESHTGRPTKIEGNPDHPASRGTAGVLEQASLLGLYDPERARWIRRDGRKSSWSALRATIGHAEVRRAAGARGQGLHLLMEPIASPLIAHLLARVREQYPEAHIHQYAPLGQAAELRGTQAAFGQAVQPVYDFGAADIVLSLGADFLAMGPYHLRYAQEFAHRRRIATPADAMNRLYVIETALTVTGGVADHRLPARPSEVAARLLAIVDRLERLGAALPGLSAMLAAGRQEALAMLPGTDCRQAAGHQRAAAHQHGAWLDAVAEDLLAHQGRGAVIVGREQPAAMHALAHRINLALGNAGRTVRYIEPPLWREKIAGAGEEGGTAAGLGPLAEAIHAGDVARLVILGGNPAYTAPADLDFGRLLRRVPESCYLGLYRDETARACRWVVPARHYLESWGDARAWDGTASIVQPLVMPLYGGQSEAELLTALAGEDRDIHTLLQDQWRGTMPGAAGGADFDRAWAEALQQGVIDRSAASPVAVCAVEREPGMLVDPGSDALVDPPSDAPAASTPDVMTDPVPDVLHPGALLPEAPPEGLSGRNMPSESLELALAPAATVYDGRFGNNPWLQELPDPVTTLTWGNAALLSPRTAARLGIVSGQRLGVALGERHLEIPALVVPGHAEGALTIPLGYGRCEEGRERDGNGATDGIENVAAGIGANGYALRTSSMGFAAAGVSVTPARGSGGEPRRAQLALTQQHWQMEDRPLALTTTLAEYRRRPPVAPESRERSRSIYQPFYQPPASADAGNPTAPEAWAMTIDLSACTGCGACVIACQAENNIPVVGEAGVRQGREMHWLRLDRYFTGTPDDPATVTQPMLCQHCERAPCEYVCPVGATVHSPDGINEMVYNRCVGTRFCSNNCPYKVRRFNWFDYNAEVSETERLAKNPDVTVRARGVMEKCTFCIQRVRGAQIEARVNGRPLQPGEVRTACQQTCPSEAIVFGTLTDAESPIAPWWEHPRAYSVLHDLGAGPRVRYLTRVTNPNPRLAAPRHAS